MAKKINRLFLKRKNKDWNFDFLEKPHKNGNAWKNLKEENWIDIREGCGNKKQKTRIDKTK